METGKSEGQNLESKPGQTEMVSEATAGAKGAHTGPWQTGFLTARLLLSGFRFLLAAHRAHCPWRALWSFSFYWQVNNLSRASRYLDCWFLLHGICEELLRERFYLQTNLTMVPFSPRVGQLASESTFSSGCQPLSS